MDSLFACMYRTMMLVHIYVLILIHSGESKVLYWQNKLKTVNLQINGQARYMKLRENIRGRGKEKERVMTMCVRVCVFVCWECMFTDVRLGRVSCLTQSVQAHVSLSGLA